MTNNQKKKKQSPNLLKNKNHIPKEKSCLVKPKKGKKRERERERETKQLSCPHSIGNK